MDNKQKMKFDELMKKLKGGKEHMKFKRMAKTPVQGDDMFHGYVKDLATGAIKETVQEGYFNKELESGQYVPGMEKMYVDIIKKNGGKNIEVNKPTRREPSLSIDFDGGNITKMEKDIENKGDGTETLDESVQEPVAFSDAQLSKMKKAYSTLKRIDPSSQNYKKLKTAIGKLDVDRLEQIARAKIRFVSVIAAGEYAKKSGKRLHARDYMESTELEESVKISFHSKGAKTKWMKKQAVASKEILNQTPTSVELPSRWKDLSKKKDHDEIFSVVAERKLTDAEMDKREKVAKAIEKDSPDMPMGKKMAIATNVAKGVQMENDEYDNEGGMALSQLRTAKSAVEDLMASIQEMDNLPEWVQSKLTKAVDYMDSVRDYMASEEVELDEIFSVNEAAPLAPALGSLARVGTKAAAGTVVRAAGMLAKGALATAAVPLATRAINKSKSSDDEDEKNESMARARADARRHMSGRGAQRGMAPLKKDVDNNASDADRKAANKNIIMQIKKAADLPNGAEVEFPSGKKKLDRNTAQKLLTKFGSLRRSSEKDTFQKSIRSLDDVKKLIGR